MNYFENFKKKNLKYDIINKFFIKNTKQIPKLKKITLNLDVKHQILKLYLRVHYLLEIITNQQSFLTLQKNPI
jgi:ribosomal protein L5